MSLVISGTILKRRLAIEELEEEFRNNSNAPGTQQNHLTRKKRYKEFCNFSNIKPYPCTEFKLCKYATYLTDLLKTVESIKRYCSTICDENEMLGHKPLRKGIKYFRTIRGIKRQLRHRVKKAAPMTHELLEKIEAVVNMNSDKEVVIWTSMLTGYNLVLRKSNLVPLKRVHDAVHNISRSDVRYSEGVMVFVIDWSKTNQFGEELQTSPLVADKHSPICAVRWRLLHMMERIPAGPEHNLFSFYNKQDQLVPITYRDLMTHMRKWLELVGTDASRYSSHSLRRGATTHCHKKSISSQTIQEMGAWRSDCYKSYIDVDIDTRVRACYKFNEKF